MAEPTNHNDEFMVPWTEMQGSSRCGTREHYEYLGPAFYEHARESLVDNLMMLLGLLKGPKLGSAIRPTAIHTRCSPGTRASTATTSPSTWSSRAGAPSIAAP